MTILLIIGILVLMAFGAPLFSVLLFGGALGAEHTGAGPGRSFWGDFSGQMSDILSIATGEQATVFSTVPLFIFAGYLMAEAKTADRIVRMANAGFGWLPGGLAIVTILACAVFTTFTGASGVTIVALGGLLLPLLLKEKYSERFSLGLVAGTGSCGLLFPPAVPLVVYGTVYGAYAQTIRAGSSTGSEMELISFTIDRFLFAGIVPGLVLIGALCLYAIVVAIRTKNVPRHPFNGREFLRGLRAAFPELILPFLIIISIANGIQLPEAAALTVLYVFVLEAFYYRDLSVRALGRIVGESMTLVGAIFIIIFAAQAFTNFLNIARVPEALFHWVEGRIESRWVFLLALNGLLLLVGMVMDIFSAIVVVVPLIILPAQKFGIDPFHLGVIFLLNLEIGYLHPPVGLNLFITSFAFRKPILEVTIATLPFLFVMVVVLVLVTYVPALTVVPPPERRGLLSATLREVTAARERVTSVQSVPLGPDKTLKIADCAAISDVLNRELCQKLFIDVTACRAGPETARKTCEEDLVKTYLEDTAEEPEE